MNGELKSRASSISNCKDIPTAMLDQLTPFWPGSLATGAIFYKGEEETKRRKREANGERTRRWIEIGIQTQCFLLVPPQVSHDSL